MTKTHKQILFALSAVAVLALLWVLLKNKSAKPVQAATPLEPAIAPALPLANDSFPLKVTSKGPRVEQLQMFLQRKKGAQFPKFGIDGHFQQETLESLQKHMGTSEVTEAMFKEYRMSDFKTYVFAKKTA